MAAQPPATWHLLPQSEEDALHTTRLLSVEEKPFKRITKRLLGPNSLLSQPLKQQPTPPPEGTSTGESAAPADPEAFVKSQLEARRQLHEDILLDFEAFDDSIARIQFLHNANARERERYASEKLRIESAAQDVIANTASLRIQLQEAQATMNQRKSFDLLAEKITNNRLLKPRSEQAVALEKLEEEIRELEREKDAFRETWRLRGEQYRRIREECENMRSQIRDEKEEVERKEGMEKEEDGEGSEGEVEDSREATAKEGRSSGGATPRHASGEDGDGHKDKKLKPSTHSKSGSRSGSAVPSRAGSVAPTIPESAKDSVAATPAAETKDEEMVDAAAETTESVPEQGEEVETPTITVRQASAEHANTPGAAEGADKMDTT
jgi:hypothetical protein